MLEGARSYMHKKYNRSLEPEQLADDSNHLVAEKLEESAKKKSPAVITDVPEDLLAEEMKKVNAKHQDGSV